MNDWVWLCLNTMLLTKTGQRSDVARGLQVANPSLKLISSLDRQGQGATMEGRHMLLSLPLPFLLHLPPSRLGDIPLGSQSEVKSKYTC